MGRYRRLIILATGGILVIVAAVVAKAALSYRARRYLDSALQIVRTHSFKRHDIPWEAVRAQAVERSQGALTRAQTYDAIGFVLKSLGDHHSGFIPPEAVSKLNAMTVADNVSPEGKILFGQLGYVRVPAFVSGNQQAVNQAAAQLQGVVKEIDAQHPCGWVVDLAENGGGNMWPMLAGLGPILGDGRLGAFVDPDGLKTDWSYASGVAAESGRPRAQVVGAGYKPRTTAAPVAVLIGRTTASSGEAVAVAFIGRPNSRMFGQHTRGLSTSNEQFLLNDGAMINLSVAVFADRNGRLYPNGVEPDEQAVPSAGERIPEVARNWLLHQPACRPQ